MMEKVVDAIQDIYPDDYAYCYGCGRLNEGGHQLRTGWEGNKTVTIFTPKPEHSGGNPGFTYGGIIASFIDCHGTGSASLFLHKKNGHEIGDGMDPPLCVTASLHVDYLRPTPMGIPLKAVGTVTEIHPKRFKVETTVYANDEVVVTGEVVAVVKANPFGK